MGGGWLITLQDGAVDRRMDVVRQNKDLLLAGFNTQASVPEGIRDRKELYMGVICTPV